MAWALVDAIVFATLVGLAFAPLEALLPQHGLVRRAFATDVAFAVLGAFLTRALLALVVGGVLAQLDRLAPDAPILHIGGGGALSSLFEVLLGLVVFETMGYAYHRLAHRVPWFWKFHEVHHASETLDWLASFRQHPLEIVVATLVQNAPLVLLGIPFGPHATVVALLRIHTVFVHADLRVPLGPLRHVIATPRFHHRHHRRGGEVANFATLFPGIDRLFGTHADDEASEFGLPDRPVKSFAGWLIHPFVRDPVETRPRTGTPGIERPVRSRSGRSRHGEPPSGLLVAERGET